MIFSYLDSAWGAFCSIHLHHYLCFLSFTVAYLKEAIVENCAPIRALMYGHSYAKR